MILLFSRLKETIIFPSKPKNFGSLFLNFQGPFSGPILFSLYAVFSKKYFLLYENYINVPSSYGFKLLIVIGSADIHLNYARSFIISYNLLK